MRKRSSLTYGGAAAFLASILVGSILYSQRPSTNSAAVVPSTKEAAAAVELDEFGIAAAGLETIDRRVQRHETFAEILTAHNVPYAYVVELADSARPIFDVRNLRAGRTIRLYRDSLRKARYLVYERDPVNYVVFDLAHDSASVVEGRRHIRTKRRQIAASIDGSLYETLGAQNLPELLVPKLAMRLSEIFAWQVDFFRIREGDHFGMIYEERLIDGEVVDVGRIVAARFAHHGSDHFGFYFDEGERPDYYDRDGNSLRKALLKAPLKYRRISSRYSRRRFHPVQKRYKAHLGTDYAADRGTPIVAVGDGVVLDARYERYNGNYVKIRHNGTYTTGYLHMSRIASGVRPGTQVRQGQVIGHVGSTGLATGPHVCYRYWKNGRQIDPLTDSVPPAHPVDSSLRDDFMVVRDSLMPVLLGPTLPSFTDRLAGTGSDLL